MVALGSGGRGCSQGHGRQGALRESQGPGQARGRPTGRGQGWDQNAVSCPQDRTPSPPSTPAPQAPLVQRARCQPLRGCSPLQDSPPPSVLQPPPVRTTLRPHLPRAHHSAPSAGARPNRSHVGAAQQSLKAGGGWMDGRQGDRWMEGGWTMDRWMRVDRSPTAVQRLRGPMMLANGVRQRPGQEASRHPRPPPSPTPRAPPLPASLAARVHLSSTCPAVTPTGDRATPCLCPTNPARATPSPVDPDWRPRGSLCPTANVTDKLVLVLGAFWEVKQLA